MNMQNLDQRITRLENTVTNIKNDMESTNDVIEIRDLVVDVIKSLQKLNNVVRYNVEKADKTERELADLKKRFDDYIKKEADIQEDVQFDFIYKKLRSKFNGGTVHKINITNFYNMYITDPQPLTEIDGCIHVDGRIKTAALQASFFNNTGQQQKRSFTNNSKFMNPKYITNDLLIIEAKHSINKAKIDKKLQQIYTIHEIFQKVHTLSHTEYTTLSKKFRDMFDNYFRDMYDTAKIYLIIVSDSISPTYIDYIINLNEGITSYQYDTCTYNILREDTFLANEIKKDKNIHPTLKKSFLSATTMDEIRNLFADKTFQKYENYMSYLTPYDELHPFFDFIRGRITLVYQQNMYTSYEYLK